MIAVTCAIIRNEENEILVVQRGTATDNPLKWEFPGGKVANDETAEDCIVREIKEELSIEIVICERLEDVIHDYGHRKIRLIPFICDTLDEVPFLSEHIAYKWLEEKDLLTPDYCKADIFVAENYINHVRPEKSNHATEKTSDDNEISVDAELQALINNMMSAKEAEWVATSAIENPAIFIKLLEYSNSKDKKLAFRSSWTLTKVCDRYPELIYPFMGQIVDSLSNIDNESTLRSFLRILSLSDPDKINCRQHGLLADFCFSSLNSGSAAIAVKVYAMEILLRLTLIYPELANELSSSIRIMMEDGPAAITSKGRTVLRKLSEMPMD